MSFVKEQEEVDDEIKQKQNDLVFEGLVFRN